MFLEREFSSPVVQVNSAGELPRACVMLVLAQSLRDVPASG
jgi:hypothetical protein